MTEGGRFPGTRLEWMAETKRMNLRVYRADWDVLHREAKRRGVGIGALTREVLRKYCEEAQGGTD